MREVNVAVFCQIYSACLHRSDVVQPVAVTRSRVASAHELITYAKT
jgi:hypothetical protein